MSVGRRIKNIRIGLGLTMKEFGEKLEPKASDSNVSRWERGIDTPNNARLKRIAELGNISIQELLDGSDVPEKSTLGEEIRRLRKEKGLTLKELAEDLGLSFTYLSQMEKGDRNISLDKMSELAKYFEVSKIYLYKCAGYLDETDILELIDENKKLREALQKACDSLGADIKDYFER